MLKTFSLLVLCGIFFIPKLIGQPLPKNIAGRVLDHITRRPIEDVIVVNKSTNKTTLTDNDGYYYLKASSTDTLIFYLVGYYVKKILPSQGKADIQQVVVTFLSPNVEELKEIEITANKRKSELQKYPFNQTPADISSPISFIFERYSKKYKQYRKIELLEKAKYETYVRESRFNKEIVNVLTGLKDLEAVEFMEYCNFTTEYLLQVSDYDFIVAVKRKYKYFIERR